MWSVVFVGDMRTHASYLQDGSLLVHYPHNMAVALETSPHPLLSSEEQLQLKRKLVLPGNGIVNKLEWRFFPRGESIEEMIGLRRKLRVGSHRLSPAQHADVTGYSGKSLTVRACSPPPVSALTKILLLLLYQKMSNVKYCSRWTCSIAM